MDISSSSQYNSSGSEESGWTHYLDQSYLSSENHNFHRKSGIVDHYEGNGARIDEEEEEEDLSMVSDASSGPPQYLHHEEDYQRYCVNWYPSSTSQYTEKTTKNKKAKEYGINHQQASPLDDTASSPVINCPNKKGSFSGNGAVESALDFPQCLSATRVKRNPKLQKHFSFFGGGKQASEDP